MYISFVYGVDTYWTFELSAFLHICFFDRRENLDASIDNLRKYFPVNVNVNDLMQLEKERLTKWCDMVRHG